MHACSEVSSTNLRCSQSVLQLPFQFGFKIKFSHGITHVRSSEDFIYLNISRSKILCSISINEFLIFLMRILKPTIWFSMFALWSLDGLNLYSGVLI